MARRETYAQLKFRADAAEKREDMKRQQRIAAPTAYKNRPERATGFYNSYLKDGVIYQVNYVIQNANALISGTPGDTDLTNLAPLGLLKTVPTGKSAVTITGTGSKPAMAKWWNGKATPTIKTTPWGTRVVSFADKTGTGTDAQSHRSCPVGDLTSPFSFEGIVSIVDSLLTANKTKLLGNGGKLTIVPEQGNLQRS